MEGFAQFAEWKIGAQAEAPSDAMADSPTDDQELLRQLAKASEAAFCALYNRYQGPIYRFALHMTARTERITVRNGETQIVNVETKTFAAKIGRISDDEWPHDSVKREDLGSQEIEGLNCQGKRETVTIATGAIGNDRPLEITSENWYSPELRTVVLRKHSDPRFGETLYRLSEIKLGEPDASLFQVPADYKAITKPGFTHRILKPEAKLPNE